MCRLGPDDPLPSWATGSFTSITRTPAELSIVCVEARLPGDIPAERGFRALAVDGPLDFALTGVLAALATPLAAAAVPIFAISTHDTDWLLVRAADLAEALAALRRAGHRVVE